MIEERCVLVNRAGLHARSSSKLAELASRFDCAVQVGIGTKVVDGKSILALMMLAATQGTEITLTIQGAEEEEAMTALLKLIAEGFGEPR